MPKINMSSKMCSFKNWSLMLTLFLVLLQTERTQSQFGSGVVDSQACEQRDTVTGEITGFSACLGLPEFILFSGTNFNISVEPPAYTCGTPATRGYTLVRNALNL